MITQIKSTRYDDVVNVFKRKGFNLRHALYIFFISCSNEFLHLNSSNCDNNYEGNQGILFIHHNVYSTDVCNEKTEAFLLKKKTIAMKHTSKEF